ncbi:MAG: trigger factor, partial [Clostridia bacterium]|nr:trigger factor [Clostridia bacterium]
MLKSANKTDTNTYTLEVSISGEDFKAAIAEVFKKQRKKISIPGFRKGKVPMQMIERYYGKGVFYEDALDLVYPDAVSDAIKESGIDAVSSPYDVDIKEIGDDGVEMTMKVTVKPEVEVGEYKGLKAEKAEATATAAEVKKELEALQERNARIITVEDRAVELGDITVIDFEGFVDGKAFEGGKGEDFDLTIGSGQFIPGFEDQIIGHNAGDEFDVNVTFPTEYDPKLAGKDATFKVKVKEIKTKELPELDDEFAKDVSDEADTLADLKKSIKADLTAKKK